MLNLRVFFINLVFNSDDIMDEVGLRWTKKNLVCLIFYFFDSFINIEKRITKSEKEKKHAHCDGKILKQFLLHFYAL